MSLYPSALAFAVHSLLTTEHDTRPIEDVAPWVMAAESAAIEADLDPRLVVAVLYVESRVSPVIGDHGRACGPYQHHVRFMPLVRSAPRLLRPFVRGAACRLLMVSPAYAARVAVERLSMYRDAAAVGGVRVCHYNQGNRCRRGERYTGAVAAIYRRL